MKLATIEIISDVYKHPNADSLDIVKVLGYQLVTQIGLHEKGKKIIYVRPDTVLPLDQTWSEGYRDYAPTRVKAIKLRKEWSEGIIVTFEQVDENLICSGLLSLKVGQEVSDIIGVTKYEPPAPQDIWAVGYLPTDIPITDEERWENLVGTDQLPLGEKVDLLLKIDGSSTTVFAKHTIDMKEDFMALSVGVCGRKLAYKLDSENDYVRITKANHVITKLTDFMKRNKIADSIALRGEIYGEGIQSGNKNPSSKRKKGFAIFSVFNITKREYARKGDPLYFLDIAEDLGIETVPVIARDVVLTQELIDYYSTGIKTLNNEPFEGVVVQHANGSFKIINKDYDSKK
jgi:RNA ligase (TIGR02306 family)